MTDTTQILLSLTKDSPLDTLLYYLLKYNSPGAQQYTINLLYYHPISKVSFYIPQLINIALQRESFSSFESFFYDIALRDYNLAMKLFWHLSTFREENQIAKTMIIHLERIIVIGNKHVHETDSHPAHLFNIENLGEDPEVYLRKMIRADYHLQQEQLTQYLIRISQELINEKVDIDSYLKACLCNLNSCIKDIRLRYSKSSCYTKRLFRGLALPLDFSDYVEQIVAVNYEDCKFFRTKCRVPYLVIFETIDINEEDSSERELDSSTTQSTNRELDTPSQYSSRDSQARPDLTTIPNHGTGEPFFDSISELSEANYEFLSTSLCTDDSPWGEPWAEICNRIRARSEFGQLKSWKARGVIIKSNDDLRQELLAMQVIKKCSEIFSREGLKIWLRPYNILITSQNSGMIEFLPDSVSIHYLKKKNKDCKSLAEIFYKIWPNNFEEIKNNFVQSMAGYSLISYILNLKDRHNGNILIDSAGHVIHIDFGFFLTCSPGGNFGFETAPFKLTKEMIDIMGGYSDEMFNYFKVLIYQGFIALRKYFSELVLILEMMLPSDYMPCFQDPARAIKDFKMRFFTALTEDQCMNTVRDLISTSAENWKTTQYDNFQRRSNSIL